jgi:hypothetical protein
MSQKIINEDVSQHKTLQWVVFIFSIVFFFVLANGYYNLFVNKNSILAFVVGLSLASLAWGLAKFIGSSKEKIQGNLPLFVLLLLLSAVGVFNSLMINLEGKKIFLETIDEAQITYKDLPLIAKKALKNEVIEQKRARVDALKESFFAELHNPQNCGQGPVALQRAKELELELPGFKLLAPTSQKNSCANIDGVISTYNKSIESLFINSKEVVEANYKEIQEVKDRIVLSEANEQARLEQIKFDINNGGNLLVTARDNLEKVATDYQKLARELTKYSNMKVKTDLDMSSVRNLGEWSQIINLILSRLQSSSTYVYLFLAFFFDWILVYLFSRLSDLKKALPNKKPLQQATNISSPW